MNNKILILAILLILSGFSTNQEITLGFDTDLPQVSPDGQYIAYRSGDNIKLINLNSSSQVWSISGQSSSNHIVFSEDRNLVSICTGSNVKIYNSQNGSLVGTISFNGLRSAFGTNGQRLSVQSSTQTKIYDISNTSSIALIKTLNNCKEKLFFDKIEDTIICVVDSKINLFINNNNNYGTQLQLDEISFRNLGICQLEQNQNLLIYAADRNIQVYDLNSENIFQKVDYTGESLSQDVEISVGQFIGQLGGKIFGYENGSISQYNSYSQNQVKSYGINIPASDNFLEIYNLSNKIQIVTDNRIIVLDGNNSAQQFIFPLPVIDITPALDNENFIYLRRNEDRKYLLLLINMTTLTEEQKYLSYTSIQNIRVIQNTIYVFNIYRYGIVDPNFVESLSISKTLTYSSDTYNLYFNHSSTVMAYFVYNSSLFYIYEFDIDEDKYFDWKQIYYTRFEYSLQQTIIFSEDDQYLILRNKDIVYIYQYEPLALIISFQDNYFSGKILYQGLQQSHFLLETSRGYTVVDLQCIQETHFNTSSIERSIYKCTSANPLNCQLLENTDTDPIILTSSQNQLIIRVLFTYENLQNAEFDIEIQVLVNNQPPTNFSILDTNETPRDIYFQFKPNIISDLLPIQIITTFVNSDGSDMLREIVQDSTIYAKVYGEVIGGTQLIDSVLLVCGIGIEINDTCQNIATDAGNYQLDIDNQNSKLTMKQQFNDSNFNTQYTLNVKKVFLGPQEVPIIEQSPGNSIIFTIKPGFATQLSKITVQSEVILNSDQSFVKAVENSFYVSVDYNQIFSQLFICQIGGDYSSTTCDDENQYIQTSSDSPQILQQTNEIIYFRHKLVNENSELDNYTLALQSLDINSDTLPLQQLSTDQQGYVDFSVTPGKVGELMEIRVISEVKNLGISQSLKNYKTSSLAYISVYGTIQIDNNQVLGELFVCGLDISEGEPCSETTYAVSGPLSVIQLQTIHLRHKITNTQDLNGSYYIEILNVKYGAIDVTSKIQQQQTQEQNPIQDFSFKIEQISELVPTQVTSAIKFSETNEQISLLISSTYLQVLSKNIESEVFICQIGGNYSSTICDDQSQLIQTDINNPQLIQSINEVIYLRQKLVYENSEFDNHTLVLQSLDISSDSHSLQFLSTDQEGFVDFSVVPQKIGELLEIKVISQVKNLENDEIIQNIPTTSSAFIKVLGQVQVTGEVNNLTTELVICGIGNYSQMETCSEIISSISELFQLYNGQNLILRQKITSEGHSQVYKLEISNIQLGSWKINFVQQQQQLQDGYTDFTIIPEYFGELYEIKVASTIKLTATNQTQGFLTSSTFIKVNKQTIEKYPSQLLICNQGEQQSQENCQELVSNIYNQISVVKGKQLSLRHKLTDELQFQTYKLNVQQFSVGPWVTEYVTETTDELGFIDFSFKPIYSGEIFELKVTSQATNINTQPQEIEQIFANCYVKVIVVQEDLVEEEEEEEEQIIEEEEEEVEEIQEEEEEQNNNIDGENGIQKDNKVELNVTQQEQLKSQTEKDLEATAIFLGTMLGILGSGTTIIYVHILKKLLNNNNSKKNNSNDKKYKNKIVPLQDELQQQQKPTQLDIISSPQEIEMDSPGGNIRSKSEQDIEIIDCQ